MITAIDAAAYIQQAARLERYQSKNLQKLLYFAQAWHLAWTGRPLFDEPFEAWPEGPVERNVYRENRYGQLAGGKLDEETRGIIDAVIAHYANRPLDELIALTHVDAPWLEARKDLGPTESSRRQLNTKTMLDFYTAKTLAADNAPSRPAFVARADEVEVLNAGAAVIERWRDGLDLLATK